MSEQTNYINLDTILGEKKETAKDQVIVIQEAITPITPTRIVDWDSILNEVCYKLPKGYPTVVDGVFTEREEIIIINEALEAEGLSTLPLPEAGKVNIAPKAEKQKKIIQPTDFALWMKSISAVERTKFFELIPIVQALSKDQRITTAGIVSIIEKHNSMDWGDAVDGVVGKLKFFLKKSPNTVKFLDDYYLAGKIKDTPINPGFGMTDIYRKEPISSFMWARIEQFYKVVAQIDTEENKVFAADVILFWGVTDPYDSVILEKIKKAVANPVTVKGFPSIIQIDKNKYMACVSLKAGAGRLGKLTSYFNNFLQESVGDSNSQALDEDLSDIWKAVKGKARDYWEKAESFFTNLLSGVKKAFSNSSPQISLANNISKDLMEFERLIDTADTQSEQIDEANKGEDIICNICIKSAIDDMNKKFLPDYIKGKAFNNFNKLMIEYTANSSFRYKFNALDNKKSELSKAVTNISTLVNSIQKAKQSTKVVLGKNGKTPIKCQPLQMKPIPRSSFKDILFISANQNAIQAVTNMLKSAFAKGIPKKNTTQSFLKIAINLNAQSIFGKSASIPLVKFTGQEPPIQLGSKSEYIKNKTDKLSKFTSELSDMELPVVGLFISPSSGRLKGDNPYYYNVTLYTLYNIEPKDDGTITADSFQYATITLSCNSGSDFTFAVEGTGTANGNILLKNLNTK